MFATTGIAVVVIAMLSWGLGDFLIQRSTRAVGDRETLFLITAFGVVLLLPFVWSRLPAIAGDLHSLLVLVCSGAFIGMGAMLQLESFKVGKIAVVEPMLPFEIPAASILAFLLLGDAVGALQTFLIVTLIIGLFMISFQGRLFSKRFLAEKGVLFGLGGAALMGVGDFFLGWGSRIADPLTANFVADVVMAAGAAVLLIGRGRMRRLISDLRHAKGLIFFMAVLDNTAWIAYAFAMSLIPIAVATGLAESSCIIGVLLGIFINKEKLEGHQRVGLIVAIVSAVTLAFLTSN